MSCKVYTPEQIIRKLRKADIFMAQGKIKRYHRSIKNVINLQNYYLPGELELEIKRFVEYYNNKRYHESLDNLTPATVYRWKQERMPVAEGYD
ncbi:MAG: transposase [Candidatus Latescibacteria bacterium]|jgi:transposase InsO family protein|nr:transposase [Candidatus Latescibacterota bacterium]